MKKILTIFFIAIGLYIIFNNVAQFKWWPLGKEETQATVTNDIEDIAINVSGLSATVIPENRDDVKAVLKGKGKVFIDKQTDKITISVKREWFEWFSFTKHANLKVYIPEDYHNNVEIDLGSGNLDISGKSKQNPIKWDELAVEVSSGNLELKNIKVNHFEHDGASGNVQVDTFVTKTGSFEVSSGNLTIKHYTGAVKAEMSSGRLDLQLDKLADDVDINVSSGTVKLDLPKNASFKLNGTTSSGNISCDFPLKKNETNHRMIKGVHGSGKHNIDLRVSSGNISVF